MGSKSATGKQGSNSEVKHAPTVVKFAFENPLKILASNEESAKLFAQNRAAYYPGATRAVNPHHNSNGFSFSDTSDEDDDEDGAALPDRIDLRAMFYNKAQGDNENRPMNANTTGGEVNINHGDISMGNCGAGLTPHQLALLRKAQGPPPRLTTDMMQGEQDKINTKVKTFMNRLAHVNATQQSYSNRKLSSLLEDVSHKMDSTTTITITDLGIGTAGDNQQQSLPKFISKGTSTAENTTLASEKTNLLSLSKSASTPNLNKHDAIEGSKISTEGTDGDIIRTSDHQETEQAPKYNWRLIRGREQHANSNEEDGPGGLKNPTTVRPEDLVLQALTGIPIRNALQTHVPLHSASRALRHTATFKMHKIVERLISERTKYQRHQVDQLKRQMSLDAGQGGGGGAGLQADEPRDGLGNSGDKREPDRLVTRKISQVSINS